MDNDLWPLACQSKIPLSYLGVIYLKAQYVLICPAYGHMFLCILCLPNYPYIYVCKWKVDKQTNRQTEINGLMSYVRKYVLRLDWFRTRTVRSKNQMEFKGKSPAMYLRITAS